MQSTRADVCLFLLTQRALASVPDGRGVRTPWAEYASRFLPSSVPVPSTWSAPERKLLQGTTLEVRPVHAGGKGEGAAASVPVMAPMVDGGNL